MRLGRQLGVALLTITLLALTAYAQDWGKRPYLTFKDNANIIQVGESKPLDQKIERISKEIRADIRVIFLDSLGGKELTNVSYQIVKDWKMGKGAPPGRYVFILVVRKDRKARIEWGKGLDNTTLPQYTQNIMNNVMVPRFKRKKYIEGITEGLLAIQRAIEGKYQPVKPPPTIFERYPWINIVIFLAVMIFGGPYLLPLFFLGGLGGYSGSGGGFDDFGGGGFGGGGGYSGGGGGVSGSW